MDIGIRFQPGSYTHTTNNTYSSTEGHEAQSNAHYLVNRVDGISNKRSNINICNSSNNLRGGYIIKKVRKTHRTYSNKKHQTKKITRTRKSRRKSRRKRIRRKSRRKRIRSKSRSKSRSKRIRRKINRN